MAFKELADLDCGTTTALGGRNKKTGKNNPTRIEGYLIGTRQVASPKSKTGFASLHVLQTQEGNVGVWGKTNLDQQLANVTPGQMIRISFTGMVETKNNPMYKYKVEVDADNTIEVASASTGNTASGEGYAGTDEYGSSGDDEEEGDLYGDEQPVDAAPPARRAVPPKTAASAPDAERQAKVKALLSGNRNKAVS